MIYDDFPRFHCDESLWEDPKGFMIEMKMRFPGLDLAQETNDAYVWLTVGKGKKKGAKYTDMKAFLSNWFRNSLKFLRRRQGRIDEAVERRDRVAREKTRRAIEARHTTKSFREHLIEASKDPAQAGKLERLGLFAEGKALASPERDLTWQERLDVIDR